MDVHYYYSFEIGHQFFSLFFQVLHLPVICLMWSFIAFFVVRSDIYFPHFSEIGHLFSKFLNFFWDRTSIFLVRFFMYPLFVWWDCSVLFPILVTLDSVFTIFWDRTSIGLQFFVGSDISFFWDWIALSALLQLWGLVSTVFENGRLLDLRSDIQLKSDLKTSRRLISKTVEIVDQKRTR